ncbi:polysaccharide export outer membrane protein [Larkinella arboricola]|uniref:Polysaccharide export outer membrane protein n=1 Tax=Larkinella arboricola TaxID=643671 RepID=A0A327X7D9_LARAB|nr:polysaccharide biosynthesis/export family protein [Larkinella arboricola]RAK02569.1 polysaccharide export outer membrane protein [Larkinella arboricola]
MKNWNWLVFGLMIIGFSSCISQKQITYFQGPLADSTAIVQEITNRYVPVIQINDLLGINVNSLNPEASSFFNPYAGIEQRMNLNSFQGQVPVTSAVGYLVDAEGNVQLPLVGKIKIAGLTSTGARDLIQEKLKKYLKEPTVAVRFLNFKVSVLGEVARPSMFSVPNEQMTLTEALSLAGDITIYGRRDNVMIIRETNGKREFGRVNMNQRDLFKSPFYYLHPNDVIYVEPGKARLAYADRFYTILPSVIGALSFIAVILRNY